MIVEQLLTSFPTAGFSEPARSNYRQLRNRKRFYVQRCQLAYKKSLFQELNGFQGNDTIASGDDVFLLQKR
jgi:hypothetical protein